MKINAINLQTYQNLSVDTPQKSKPSGEQKQSEKTKGIEGARFNEFLDKNEIKYLNRNFKTDGVADSSKNGRDSVDAVRRRIDILA